MYFNCVCVHMDLLNHLSCLPLKLLLRYWTLRTPFGILQKESHSILSSTPKHLVNVEDVLQVIELFSVNKVCSGIDDTKLQPLIERHKGAFMDCTGKCLCSTQCAVKLFLYREKRGSTV